MKFGKVHGHFALSARRSEVAMDFLFYRKLLERRVEGLGISGKRC
ncbi:hypothetical protein HMPREF0322_02225 [Desulfitobacterium hafniense DP7]|uniref:Uncharacterized protein n=1 Tax=Desulfitobacterium hafniense DP7 TaxID=537010 RepID=G9XMN7_DESHA|nr:hypothetical protein HMPREF0322_02225 [Desulfitobacterium hafniense DP7]